MKSSDLVIQKERFTTGFYDEMEPLIVQHASETYTFGGRKPNPDIDLFLQMQDMDMLRLYTLRDKGRLGGYLLYAVTPHLQFRDVLYAAQAALFIDPLLRKTNGVFSLIRFSEEDLIAQGVMAIAQHTNMVTDVGRLYESMGYELFEKNYIKVIGG